LSAESPSTRPATLRFLQALVAASLVVPGFIFAVAAWQSWGQIVHEAEDRVRRTAAVLHEHALKVFETHALVIEELDFRIFGADWRWIEQSEDLRRELAKVPRRLSQVEAVWLVDGAGRVRNATWHERSVGMDVADREYFAAARTSDALLVSKPYVSRVWLRAQFNVSRRRTAPDGGFDGVIAIGVRPDYFAEFFRTTVGDRGGTMILLRGDGAVLVQEPPAVGAPIMLAAAALEEIAAEGEAFGRQTGADGIERLSSFRSLRPYPVAIGYSLEIAAVVDEWRGVVGRYAAFAGPATLALFLVAVFALRHARREERALHRMDEQVKLREQAEEALRQGQKMEVVGQLTGGVAHDFNNLLTVIVGNLDLLEIRLGDERLARYVAAARHAAERGEQLTKQLLAFSRRQPLHPERIELAARVGQMVDLIERSLRGDIVVEATLEPGLWDVEVDPGQLELALLNIAVNARDAMTRGGGLVVAATNATLSGSEGVGGGLAGEFVRLAVTDTGEGIPLEILDRVFEPFFTTKDVGKGTGLGLSQVYGFSKQSGGAAEIDSTPGRGTTVTLYLPRATGARAPAAAETQSGAAARRRASILLVDDNREIAEVTATLLRELGHEVIVAARAREGLERLAERGFDLLFSDTVMPDGMSGVDLAREARRRFPELPILLATGYSDLPPSSLPHDFPVLAKPYSRDKLAEAVTRCLTAPVVARSG
jgi:two-component system NtrC family sensor kinase